MRRVYKNLCLATLSASIMAVNMCKNSLKNVESDNNKIFYETLLDFLQRNGTYFVNKPLHNYRIKYRIALVAHHQGVQLYKTKATALPDDGPVRPETY